MTRFRGVPWAGAVAVAAAVCAVGPTAASAGGGSAPRGCDPKGSTTIAQDLAGRFFHSLPRRSGTKTLESWYVCAFNQGASRIVYRATQYPTGGSPFPWGPSAKASGRYVAFFVFSSSAAFNWVRVVDMVTGHPTFSERIIARYYPDDLVLKPDGSIAWTAPMPPPQTPVVWEVRRHDSTGTATVDSGPGINPQSLAAGGQWLYWTDAGSPRSAPFR